MSSEIKLKLPRLTNRIGSLIVAASEISVSFAANYRLPPRDLARMLKMRDSSGRMLLDLAIDTSSFEMLQTKPIDAAVSTFWGG